MQLGFPELLSATFTDARQLLASIRRHRDALEALRAACSLASPLDDQRANHLVQIRRAHPDAKIVAFAQYAETLAMLFRKLAPAGRVAMLTANGARVAGGKLSRYEALARFAPDAVRAPPPGTAERIDLLLATDLLAEGVNLQDAQIVVHLDVPWTAARMEQRVGRVARMGSRHPFVHTYFIRPPRSAARLLRSESIVSRKWNVARLAVGAGRAPLATPLENDLHSSGVDASAANDSVTRLNEQLRACLERWRRPYTKSDDTIVASVLTSKRGLLAAVTLDGSPKLLTSLSGNVLLELGGQLSACILAAGLDTNSTEQEIDEAMAAIRLWSESESASVLAGASNSSAVHRRRLANRIDSVIDTAPPHLRVQWLERASRARRVVGVQQSAAIEAELGALMTSPLPPEEWLQKISKLSPRHNDESPSSNQLPTERGELRTPNPTERRELQLPNLDIHAVLLLRTKLVK
ncbi:MAG: helicase-related protein [Gemmatimonadaceae bacterium]